MRMAKTATAPQVEKSRTVIERKHTFNWKALKQKLETEHWRKFMLEIKVRDKLHGGKPATLDAAKAMLKARGLEDLLNAREELRPPEERAEEVVDEGLCEFARRIGKPGLWWPTNNFKAAIKENWSVLGYRLDATPRSKRGAEEIEEVDTNEDMDKKSKRKPLRGSRGAIAEALFICSADPHDPDWIYLGEKADGIDTSV